MKTKQFHISDILSITTGRLVSTRHMDGIYDILNFMTGDSLFTHQIPRGLKECKPYLLREMQWLSEIDASIVTPDNWQDWLHQQITRYGEYHEVRPIHPEDHQQIDPIEELKMMGVDESRIITFDVDELGDDSDDLFGLN